MEVTIKEYKVDMQKLLVEKGLYGAVKEYCDKIDDVTRCLSYDSHRDIQEYLCDILNLVEFSEKDKKEAAPKVAIDTLIDIVDKYRQIEQIHKQWFCDFDSATAYSRISEVLKDG